MVIEKMKEYYECPWCSKIYTKYGIGSHIWQNHTVEGNKHRISKSKMLKKKKWRNFKCPKCGKIHKKYLIDSEFKYLKGYCSYKCSNSRNHSKETKIKIANSLLTFDRNKICLYCKKPFISKRKSTKFCSRKCASKYNWVNNCRYFDWKSIAKKSYENGRSISGGRTKWIHYKDIKVQGTYELRVCYILDIFKLLGIIGDWEYTNDRFKYIGIDKKEHFYVIDFKVFTNGEFHYLEIKGYITENDKRKIQSVKNAGYKIEIWKLIDIKEYEKGLWCNLDITGVLGTSNSGSNPDRPTIDEIREKGDFLLSLFE